MRIAVSAQLHVLAGRGIPTRQDLRVIDLQRGDGSACRVHGSVDSLVVAHAALRRELRRTYVLGARPFIRKKKTLLFKLAYFGGLRRLVAQTCHDGHGRRRVSDHQARLRHIINALTLRSCHHGRPLPTLLHELLARILLELGSRHLLSLLLRDLTLQHLHLRREALDTALQLRHER